MGDTFDEVFGPDPNAYNPTQTGPVPTTMPAVLDTNLRGLAALHPGVSPTPWVIGLALVLVLLLHPRAGFNAGAKVGN